MNFIGQYIQSLVARFRSAVYLENLVDPGSDTDKFLVASGDGKIGYRTGAEVASDIGVSGTFVDLTSEVSGVLPVGNGGTGAATLGSTEILLGNGSSAITSGSDLTYSGEILSVGTHDAGIAEVVRKNSTGADTNGGQFRIRGARGTGTNKVGGELSLAGGPGTGDGAAGAIKFYGWTANASGTTPQSSILEIAAFDASGNLQIDGGLTTGSTSAINSSGVIQVASQPNITTLGGVFTGAANQLLTDDGDGTVTSESGLTYDGTSETLELGGDTFNSFKIQRKAHSDNIGGELRIFSGASGGTNKAGGDLVFKSGKGTGTALGGAIEFYVSTAGSSGDAVHFVQAVDMTITDGQVAVAGNITVTGTVDGRDVATDGTKLDGVEASATADQTKSDIDGLAITTVGTLDTGNATAIVTDASTSAKGKASFSSDNFAVSSGAVTIKDGGVDLAAEVTGVLPSANLDADTAHLSQVQTFTGAKIFAAKITQDGNQTLVPGDGAAIHIDASDITDGSTSASGTASTFNHVNIENPRILATNASVTTTNAATVYIKGAPVASTNQTITNAWALKVAGGNVDISTVTDGTWNGTVIASAYLDADTAHLTTDQTFTGIKQINLRKFPVSSGIDGNAIGDVVYFGGTTSMTVGRIYNYKSDGTSDGTWEIANADAVATSDGLLGVALGAASDTNGMLLRGMVTLDHDPGAVGDVLYVQSDNAGTTGHATVTAPSASGDCVRIVGYCVHASAGNIWFNPDSTFVEVA